MDLGLVLRRVSLEIYLHVKYMVDEMDKSKKMQMQDPSLNTEQMKKFVAQTKIKLTQLYLLTRWLSNRNVVDFFNRFNDNNGQVQLIGNGLAMKLDEMYFSHSSIYALRTEKLRFTFAGDCLIQGGQRDLPASVFLIGSSSFPFSDVVPISVNELNGYLRSRLLSSLSSLDLQDRSLTMTVHNGVLKVCRENAFEVFLTLKYLSLTAPWTILGVKILAKDSDTIKSVVDAFDMSKSRFTSLEKELFESCQRILTSLTDNCFQRVTDLCCHVSTAASLTTLHSQAVKLSNSAWKSILGVEWRVDDVKMNMSVGFWKSLYSKDYLFTLSISQMRTITTDKLLLQATLFAKSFVTSSLANVSHSLQPAGQVRGFDQIFHCQNYIGADGVTFNALLRDCLGYCVSAKLAYIHKRLTRSLANYPVLKYCLARNSNNVIIRSQSNRPELGIVLEVDVRTGRLLVDSLTEMDNILVDWKTSIELFVLEINNIESEQLFGSHMMSYFYDDNLNSIDYYPIVTTLEGVLTYLEVSRWSHHLSYDMLKRSIPIINTSTATFDNNSSSCGKHILSYEVTSWNEYDTVRQACASNYHQVFLSGTKLSNLLNATQSATSMATMTVSAQSSSTINTINSKSSNKSSNTSSGSSENPSKKLRVDVSFDPNSESSSAVTMTVVGPQASDRQVSRLHGVAASNASIAAEMLIPFINQSMDGVVCGGPMEWKNTASFSGVLCHLDGSLTATQAHQSHLYLTYRSAKNDSNNGNGQNASLRFSQFTQRNLTDKITFYVGDVANIQECSHSEKNDESACQLRLSCFLSTNTHELSNVVVEACRFSQKDCADQDIWKSELFIQECLFVTLRIFLESFKSSNSAPNDNALVCILIWWHSVQPIVEVLMFLMLHKFVRSESQFYRICPIHQSVTTNNNVKVLLSVGHVDDVEAYIEVTLHNAVGLGLERNETTISVRNTTSSASNCIPYTDVSEAKQQIVKLIQELHVEE